MIPAFAFGVPGNLQALQATAVERHEVLLQRPVSESVGNLKITGFPARTQRMDVKFPVFFVHPAYKAVSFKNSIVKIAQHGLVGGGVHGVGMV